VRRRARTLVSRIAQRPLTRRTSLKSAPPEPGRGDDSGGRCSAQDPPDEGGHEVHHGFGAAFDFRLPFAGLAVRSCGGVANIRFTTSSRRRAASSGESCSVSAWAHDMSRRKKRPPPRKFECIFCGGPGPSPEHIWSDWMRHYFTRTPHSIHEAALDNERDVGEGLPRMFEDRHGSMINKKVRAVCGKCNNGWMSGIETEAIPPLKRLMFGKRHIISPAEQLAVLRWVVLKLFVVEFDKPVSPSFTTATRRAFKETRAIPANLFLHAMAYDGGSPRGHGKWCAGLTRQAIWIGDEGESPELLADGTMQRNTVSATFGVGFVAFHIFHSYTLAVNPGSNSVFVRDFWPATSGPLDWPPHQIMTTDELTEGAGAFDRYLAAKKGRPVPIF
jgi:hypothetical protein